MNSEEWKKYSFEEKLYVTCKKMHVLKIAQFINRKILKRGKSNKNTNSITISVEKLETKKSLNKNVPKDDWNRMKEAFDKVIRNFQAVIPSDKKKIIFSGHILEFDKGTCNYLNYISENLSNAELILLSHATNINSSKANKLINFNYFKLPVTASINRYEPNVDIDVPVDIIKFIESKEYLKLAVKRLEMRHKDMGKGYAKALIYNLYRYFDTFLDHYRPAAVVLWCEFFCGHVILKDICEEKNIKVLYMEFGALPGTFAIEKNGQMGESDVSTKYQEFKELTVTDDELEKADQILDFLRQSGLNRRPQPKTDVIKEIQKKYNPDYPTVVFFGQNDFEAGILPYTNRSKEYHSPIFSSSDDAAVYLYQMAKVNHWNFIYKPHQVMVRVGECLKEKFPSSMIWVGDTDINEIIDLADVCVTIVSQCGYVSLIRQKPTVMLGYTQLRGKECCYESFRIDEIESTIKKAISEGFSKEQREAFRKHVAQLLKYYLFDDQIKKPFQIGRNISEAIDFFNSEISDIRMPEYTKKRKILFLCNNIKEFQSACVVNENIKEQVISDIIIEEKISNELIKFLQEKKCFRKFFTTKSILEEEEVDLYVDKFELKREEYTDLFVPLYNGTVLRLYSILNSINNVTIHLYDTGNLELYLKNISADRDRHKTSKRVSSFFSNLSEIILFDRKLLVWGEKLSIPITVLYHKKNLNYKYKNSGIEFYISNNWLFSEGYTSNETELVEEIITVTNNSDITVEVPNPENDLRYQLRNCKQCLNLDYILKDKISHKKIVIFSMYLDKFYHMLDSMENLYVIDLSKMLNSNCNILNSNSFRLLYSLVEEEKKDRYYRPSSMEEVSEILSYVECGER